MATVIDWDDLRRRHGNVLRAGDPVVPWDEFVAVAEDMMVAEVECKQALDEAWSHLERIVPQEDRYIGWTAYAPAPVVAIEKLGPFAPTWLHPHSDFQFKLTYGKAKRAPLAHMRRRAEEFRAYTRKIGRVLAKNLELAEATVAN